MHALASISLALFSCSVLLVDITTIRNQYPQMLLYKLIKWYYYWAIFWYSNKVHSCFKMFQNNKICHESNKIFTLVFYRVFEHFEILKEQTNYNEWEAGQSMYLLNLLITIQFLAMWYCRSLIIANYLNNLKRLTSLSTLNLLTFCTTSILSYFVSFKHCKVLRFYYL